MSIDNVLVIDTETTGLDHEKDKVVEIGAVLIKKGKIQAKTFHSLCNPGFPMPPYARAVHHISDGELAKASSFDEALIKLKAFAGKEPFWCAAQNAPFDAGFFPKKSPWICTWRCARQLWPDLDHHGNQVLRYAVPGVNEAIEKAGPEKAMPPHRALPDAWVTTHVLIAMLKEKTPDELIELTKAPILMKKIGFGMHRGKLWSEVPTSYLSWIMRQPEMDPDARFTADQMLRQK